MVSKQTLARFGQRLTPHEFRHCAATSIAEFNPGDFQIIRLILGHTTTATAERYYIRAKGREAARIYQDVVNRKRKALAPGNMRFPAWEPSADREADWQKRP